MANIVPFRGVLYEPAVVGDIQNVVAPPYDVIDQESQRALHARHPNNVVRLELGLEHPEDGGSENRYTRAARLLRDWLGSGVLRRDPHPALYYYTIEYRVPAHRSGASPVRTLKGFLSLLELEELGDGRIFPHENTRTSAKEDRLKLLEACEANFSPIFSLFSDPDGRVLDLLGKSVNVDRARIQFHDDAGSCHRLWAVTDRNVFTDLAEAMKPQPLFIADGHHRYETALTYRAQRRQGRSGGEKQPYDHVLMLFSSLEDAGLTILPTHRILTTPLPSPTQISSAFHECFLMEEFGFNAGGEASARDRFLRSLQAERGSRPAFGLALRGHRAYVLLRLRPGHPALAKATVRDRLDVAILQNHVLTRLLRTKSDEEAMLYSKDDDEALDLVLRGSAQAALLLNPPRVADVQAVAAAGLRMPHKSTYFYPKPLTGLVMHVMKE